MWTLLVYWVVFQKHKTSTYSISLNKWEILFYLNSKYSAIYLLASNIKHQSNLHSERIQIRVEQNIIIRQCVVILHIIFCINKYLMQSLLRTVVLCIAPVLFPSLPLELIETKEDNFPHAADFPWMLPIVNLSFFNINAKESVYGLSITLESMYYLSSLCHKQWINNEIKELSYSYFVSIKTNTFICNSMMLIYY